MSTEFLLNATTRLVTPPTYSVTVTMARTDCQALMFISQFKYTYGKYFNTTIRNKNSWQGVQFFVHFFRQIIDEQLFTRGSFKISIPGFWALKRAQVPAVSSLSPSQRDLETIRRHIPQYEEKKTSNSFLLLLLCKQKILNSYSVIITGSCKDQLHLVSKRGVDHFESSQMRLYVFIALQKRDAFGCDIRWRTLATRVANKLRKSTLCHNKVLSVPRLKW